MCAVPTWLRRIARDDSGQDVVEYALLTAFFGLAALAAWTSIQASARLELLEDHDWRPGSVGESATAERRS